MNLFFPSLFNSSFFLVGKGLGNRDRMKEVGLVMEGIEVKKMACGFDSSFILDSKGDLYGFGAINTNKDLEGSQFSKPKIITTDNLIKKIVCGRYHSFFLRSDGQLMVLGRGERGQLGLGEVKWVEKMTSLLTREFIKDVSCGNFHSIAVTQEGKIFTFGNNDHGSQFSFFFLFLVIYMVPPIELQSTCEFLQFHIPFFLLNSLFNCRDLEINNTEESQLSC